MLHRYTSAVLFTGEYPSLTSAVTEAVLRGANLICANLNGLRAAKLRVFSGLYKYQVWAVLFEDGSRWVRMGCLFKTLENWEKLGVKNSNLEEFPDDKSAASEERAAAFEFARQAALKL